jgi:hypothetical protein
MTLERRSSGGHGRVRGGAGEVLLNESTQGISSIDVSRKASRRRLPPGPNRQTFRLLRHSRGFRRALRAHACVAAVATDAARAG